jgi:hypothetical protein
MLHEPVVCAGFGNDRVALDRATVLLGVSPNSSRYWPAKRLR